MSATAESIQNNLPTSRGLVAAASSRVEEICVAVGSAGGLVGLFISDRGRINSTLQHYNELGYSMTRFDRDVRTNLAYSILQLICLLVTAFIWCPAPAAYFFFRRSAMPANGRA